MAGRVAIFILSSILFLSFATGNVLAQRRYVVTPSPAPEIKTIDVSYEQINPTDGGKYIWKRFREKIGLFFSFSSQNKLEFQKKLVGVRLAELKLIIDDREMAYFEKATQRYFTTTGQLTDFLISKKLNSEYQSVSELFTSHLPVLAKLRDTFKSTTAEWRFVEDDINYLKIYISKLQ